MQAIVSALRVGLAVVGRVLTAPLRMLAGIGGGGGYDAPELPAPTDPAEREGEVADMERRMAEGLTLANLLIRHAADCIVADDIVAPPPDLPAELRAWARGLSRQECEILLESDDKVVSAHIRGLFAIAGVRKVQPLEARSWAPDRSPEPDLESAITGPAMR
ncbi:MAG: hypothetical protein NT113_10415 [Hyphomicrobiales bacterium]|nr:hypothetical protein [Hyphomicrobiales bacterium]